MKNEILILRAGYLGNDESEEEPLLPSDVKGSTNTEDKCRCTKNQVNQETEQPLLPTDFYQD